MKQKIPKDRAEKNFVKAYADNVRFHKEENRKQRERLSKIRDYETGDVVELEKNGRSFNGTVFRVNQKTYSVRFDIKRIVRIGKESLSGIPNDIIEESTGDGRRFIGEEIRIVK